MDCAVYVSCADSGELRAYALDGASGGLALRQRLVPGGQLMPLAVDPSRRFLYAARRSEPLEVLSFAIDPASGELAALGRAPLPHSMANIATDRTGRWLFSASYGGDLIAVSPIDAEGRAQPASQVLATPPHAHAIGPDPSNRFVYATSLGGGVVLQFRFDAASGTLTPNTPAALRPHEAASPRHFAFGADGRFVYLLNELDAMLDVLAFDRIAGTLRTVQSVCALPPGFDGEPWAADLHLTPDGRLLYASERRSGTLAAFAVDAAHGTLAALGHAPTEAQPRSFAITPDGRWLIAAGQVSGHLGVASIDGRGALAAHARIEAPGNPNWVEVVALPG